MAGGGDAPKKTNEQKAMERRQRIALDEETASSERRLKAMAQKKLGKQSLLEDPVEQAEAPDGPTITEGFELRQGQAKKISNKGIWIGKLLGSKKLAGVGSGKAEVKKGAASLLGKGTEKAAKGVTR
jgi:hypothetical protein